MFQEKVQILWNKKVGPLYYRIGLKSQRIHLNAKPGQFVMLHLADSSAVFLRRPFSIHRLTPYNGPSEGIELLYKVIGKGTQKLSMFKKGNFVDLLGPLGKGFSIPEDLHHIFIVAGGVGVAPMVFLALSLHTKMDLSQSSVFLGGRTKEDLLCKNDFGALGMNVHISTDDGSAGDKCLVTHPLEIAVKKSRPQIIYACGPWNMLKCVRDIAKKYAVPCQISIETRMACGIGACLGCAVEHQGNGDKYLHACIDGPVFDATTLAF
ncbi:MAG: dihydroorotate dehydrogenase electron transfer subunit [Desulfobacterales bacterium]|nr:dihydroorotate dehydrogenase electron transfer subunit [Desulfobacterales bacterium]